MDPQTQAALQLLDKIGTVGLAFIVWALMTGRLITRREFDREVARADRGEQRLDKALEYGDRAVRAGVTVLEKQNG